MNSGLEWRLPLGILLILALAALAWVDIHVPYPGSILLGLALAAGLLGAGEIRWLYRTRAPQTIAWVTYVGTLLIVASGAVALFWPNCREGCPVGPLGWPLLALAVGLLLAVIGEMLRYDRPGRVMEPLSRTIFIMVYVGVLLNFALQLRLLFPGGAGIAALVSMIAVVKLCDTGAYAFGRLFGRHKMAPRISPGKTWEGAAGGIGLGVLGAYLLFEQILPRLELAGSTANPGWSLGWLVFGVTVAAAGMLGDLAESLIKRDAGEKDSSAWVPGFGGVLDILDSILAGAPVAYGLWAAGVVGV